MLDLYRQVVGWTGCLWHVRVIVDGTAVGGQGSAGKQAFTRTHYDGLDATSSQSSTTVSVLSCMCVL